MSAQARSALLRVSRRHPCPVCGKPDWCSISADGDIAVCMRKRSDHPARNGGWTHILSIGAHSPPIRPQPRERQTTPVAKRADSERRHMVYTALLDALELSEAHREDLLHRGLSPAEITRNGYVDTPAPDQARRIAQELSQYDLPGVPGFYQERGTWRMVWTALGFFIPVRDEHSRVVALLYRRDRSNETDGSGKYIWFSSAADRAGNPRPGGASSKSPTHYAKAHLLQEAREVTLTEGALKADVTAHLLHAPVIGNAPTCFGQSFAADLKEKIPQLKTVYVGFDMDWQQKESVRGALFRLVGQLEAARFQVRVRMWPPHLGKGIDDYLLSIAEGRPAA